MSLTSLIDLDLLSRFKGKIDTLLAGKLGTTGNAYRAASIPMGECDSTSTATVFTATVTGITELRDGVCVWLRNNVVTSASGFTININNLGAKPVYQSMAAAGRITTLFNINYTVLLIYNSTRVEGGCWDMVYGYNSDTNTIAYQIRRNNGTYTSKTALGRYMLLLSYSPTQVLPINALDNSTGTSKTLTTEDFDPHGPIWYYSSTTAVAANGAVAVGSMWASYNIDLRYSFNTAKTLTNNKDVYIVATPQSDGRAKLHSAPISQTLPSTEDGKIYIYLGHASSTYNVYLAYDHPIYYYKNGSIRRWVGPQDAIPTKTSDLTNDSGFGTYSKPSGGIPASDLASGVIPTVPVAETNNPEALGTASPGSSTKWARGDHVHPKPTPADIGAGTYSKPSGGIPASDLASAVQTSLGKADTALQSYTETDPTVPSWAKASSKPSYTKSEVGLGNVDNVQQYSASNPPPYPVTSVNGATGAVTIATLPAVTSSDNGKYLKVVNGAWAAGELPVYNGEIVVPLD